MDARLEIAGLDEIFDKKVEEVVQRIESAYQPLVREVIELRQIIASKFIVGNHGYLDKKQVAEIIGTKSKNGAYINQLVKEKKFPKPDRYESDKFPLWKVERVKEHLRKKGEFWRWEEWEKRQIQNRLP